MCAKDNLRVSVCFCLFFFQAEDGIRDLTVTGVQTCALPISVRNSGAVAVIEGAGDHCCEYMTGGVVVVLGPVGRNFGAGMSNGVAYVLDERGLLESRCNLEMIAITELKSVDDGRLRKRLHEHLQKTGTPRARAILAQWSSYRLLLRKVAPPLVVTAAEVAMERPISVV